MQTQIQNPIYPVTRQVAITSRASAGPTIGHWYVIEDEAWVRVGDGDIDHPPEGHACAVWCESPLVTWGTRDDRLRAEQDAVADAFTDAELDQIHNDYMDYTRPERQRREAQWLERQFADAMRRTQESKPGLNTDETIEAQLVQIKRQRVIDALSDIHAEIAHTRAEDPELAAYRNEHGSLTLPGTAQVVMDAERDIDNILASLRPTWQQLDVIRLGDQAADSIESIQQQLETEPDPEITATDYAEADDALRHYDHNRELRSWPELSDEERSDERERRAGEARDRRLARHRRFAGEAPAQIAMYQLRVDAANEAKAAIQDAHDTARRLIASNTRSRG